jgi:hypothetical protein
MNKTLKTAGRTAAAGGPKNKLPEQAGFESISKDNAAGLGGKDTDSRDGPVRSRKPGGHDCAPGDIEPGVKPVVEEVKPQHSGD